MVDAESCLTHQDVRIVAHARQCGSDAVVLLGKADLLSIETRWEVLGFALRTLKEPLGADIAAYLSGTRPFATIPAARYASLKMDLDALLGDAGKDTRDDLPAPCV